MRCPSLPPSGRQDVLRLLCLRLRAVCLHHQLVLGKVLVAKGDARPDFQGGLQYQVGWGGGRRGEAC